MLFIPGKSKKVLLAGLGNVGKRRALKLYEGDFNLVIYEPNKTLVDNFLSEVKASEGIQIEEKNLDTSSLHEEINKGIDMAVFCTPYSEEIDKWVSLCENHKLPYNRADKHGSSDFFFVSQIDKEDYSLAISTYGQNPSLSKKIREEMECYLEDKNRDKG